MALGLEERKIATKLKKTVADLQSSKQENNWPGFSANKTYPRLVLLWKINDVFLTIFWHDGLWNQQNDTKQT